MLNIISYLNRRDSLSIAVDEVINEINASDEETYKPLNRKPKSMKKDQNDILKLMKNSISNGNKSSSANINFNNLNEAKGVILSISNELKFHQKETLKCAIQAGECLYNIRELCQVKKFNDFLVDCNIKWSKSCVQFLISL